MLTNRPAMSKASKAIKKAADKAYDSAVDNYNEFSWSLPLEEIKTNLKKIIADFELAAEKYGEIEQFVNQYQTYAQLAECTESIADYTFDLADNSNDANTKKAYFEIALAYYDYAIKYHTHLATPYKRVSDLLESRLTVKEMLAGIVSPVTFTQIVNINIISPPNNINMEATKAVEIVKARDVQSAIVVASINENQTNMNVDESQTHHANLAVLIEANAQVQTHDQYTVRIFDILLKSITSTHKSNVARLARTVGDIFNTDNLIINPLEHIIKLPLGSTNLFAQRVPVLLKIKNLFDTIANHLNAKVNMEELGEIALYNIEKKLGLSYLELMTDKLSRIIAFYFAENAESAIMHISECLITLNQTTQYTMRNKIKPQ